MKIEKSCQKSVGTEPASGNRAAQAGAGTENRLTAGSASRTRARRLAAVWTVCTLAAILLVGCGLISDASKQDGNTPATSKAGLLPELSAAAMTESSRSTESGEAHVAPYTGSCGSALRWRYDPASNTLTLEGTGEMNDYPEYTKAPWAGWQEDMKKLVLPEGLTSIGASAFRNCAALSAVTLPESLRSIGAEAFLNCTGLRSLTLPEGLSSIEDYAFYHCTGLLTVKIPESMTVLDNDVFSGCENLISVDIPDSVTVLDDDVFSGCESLNSLTLSKNIRYIGGCVFEDCPKLRLSLDPENPCFCMDGQGVLYSKNKDRLIYCPMGFSGDYEIPDTVTALSDSAFCGCSGLRSVTIPDSVTTIGKTAFCDCTGLTHIELPAGLRLLDNYALGSCTGLTEISLPDSLHTINEGVFSGCRALVSIELPGKLISVGPFAFANCSSLCVFDAPDSLRTIERCAFDYCHALRSITLPADLNGIGKSAFTGCEALTIRSTVGSRAERYAEENGIPFEALP